MFWLSCSHHQSASKQPRTIYITIVIFYDQYIYIYIGILFYRFAFCKELSFPEHPLLISIAMFIAKWDWRELSAYGSHCAPRFSSTKWTLRSLYLSFTYPERGGFGEIFPGLKPSGNIITSRNISPNPPSGGSINDILYRKSKVLQIGHTFVNMML